MIRLQLAALFLFLTSSFVNANSPFFDTIFKVPLGKRCNSLNPKCNLSVNEARTKFLTSYEDLVKTLNQIKATSRIPISVGPLINNGDNGLLNIDVPLDKSLAPAVKTDVCGESNPNPTIRQAVVCTVTQDTLQPPRGNIDPKLVGFSTQGKALLAVRLGNPNGKRVFIVTQQHGDEAASTDAALQVLRKLTRERAFAADVLAKLDLLFLMRANPDAGEPTGNKDPAFGVPYNETTGFFRHNIDPRAGGGFLASTEPGFLGVVGRGYDLNRYNYGGLNNPIRPVESQAMVAAIHAFRPDVAFDLHGDAQKVVCELDPTSIVPNAVGGLLPSIKCKPPADPIPTLLTQRKSMVMGGFFADDATVLSGEQTAGLKTGAEFRQKARLVRSIVAEVVKAVDPKVVGSFTRFNQVQLQGTPGFTDGSFDRAVLTLGGVGSGWEVANFETRPKPSVTSIQIVDGNPTPTLGFDNGDIEPCFLKDNVCLHELLIRRTLIATVELIDERLSGDNGYCTIPLDDGVVVWFSEALGFPPEISSEGNQMFPNGGQFGVPVAISGTCAGD